MKMIISVIAVCLCTAVFADKPRFGDSFSFQIGGMRNDGRGDFTLTNDGNIRTDLDFNELGLNDEQGVIWGSFRWRFNDTWEVGVSYNDFNVNGTRTATRDFNFGDLEVTSSATVESEFDLDLFILDVTWDFLISERSHLGVGFGLHVMDTSIGISAEIDPGLGIGGPIQLRSKSESITVPLPNLTLTGGHRFTDTLYVGIKLGYFSLNIDEFDGQLISTRAMLEWRPSKNFGFALGYQYVDVEVKIDDGDDTNRFNLTFDGPLLVLTAGF